MSNFEGRAFQRNDNNFAFASERRARIDCVRQRSLGQSVGRSARKGPPPKVARGPGGGARAGCKSQRPASQRDTKPVLPAALEGEEEGAPRRKLAYCAPTVRLARPAQLGQTAGQLPSNASQSLPTVRARAVPLASAAFARPWLAGELFTRKSGRLSGRRARASRRCRPNQAALSLGLFCFARRSQLATRGNYKGRRTDDVGARLDAPAEAARPPACQLGQPGQFSLVTNWPPSSILHRRPATCSLLSGLSSAWPPCLGLGDLLLARLSGRWIGLGRNRSDWQHWLAGADLR